MLGVENIRSSKTTTTTFPASAATPITTTAAPAVVAGAGVGLIPLVAATTGEPDPRSLLVPVPTLGGSNPSTNSAGTTTSSSNSNSNSSSSNNIGSNPSTMEQVEEFVKPIIKDGEMILEVECGQNKAAMYLSKLCQGSKGPCINFQGSWLTPNEFQFVSGRETAKDWKRSIRHHGKSLKLLLAKGILTVHPTMCDCEGCRIGAVLTRKGEKRRIPNGERKRKSTGSAPENSGSGAFRAVGNGNAAVKNQDGPSDPKRVAVEKSQEGGQSPLKESSMMNLPESKGGPGLRLPEGHLSEVSKMAADSRVGPAPLMPLLSPDRGSESSNTTAAAAISPPSIPKDHKDPATTLAKPSSEKRHHSSNNSSISGGGAQSSGVSPAAAESVMSSLDVKVLSSSGGAGTSKMDKSLSRLALYQAVSASVKGEVACNVNTDGLGVSAARCDSQVPMEEKPTSGSTVRDSRAVEARSPKREPKDFSTSADVKGKPVSPEAADKLDSKDLKTDDKSLKPVNTHSAEPHQSMVCAPSSNSNNYSSMTLSPSTPLSPTGAATSSPAAPTLVAPHTRPSPTVSNPHKEERHKHTSSSMSSPPSFHSKPSPSKEENLTIRHLSPERPQTNDAATVTRHHSPAKSTTTTAKEHSWEKPRDRRQDSTPSSSSSDNSGKDHRHASRDKDSAARHHHEREVERRRAEEKSSDRDRKSGVTSGQSSKAEEPSYRGPEFQGVGVARAEGLPATAPASVPVPVADPAAFSEYMRALAAGHHGLVPPPMPPMYLRPPTDVSVSSGLLHPMHAAACGMFSTPSAMLSKDPALYATTAGTLPTASYGYGAPGMAPLPLLPHQYTAAASTSMLDYSRPFSYLPWSGGLSLMMPDAMAAAAAAAAASSSAKRSREEMESAADMAGKRLALPMAAYGAGSIAPIDYMAAYRGLATPLSCGMESSMYDKNAEFMRKRMYPDMAASAAGGAKGMESPYLASLPDYYRALYCCRCMENRPGDIRTWGVEDVVKLVSSLEGCSVYTEIFREQRVDGKILVLLTTDHLMKNLGMKLGPAMTLTSRVAKILLDSTRASGCDTCRRLASMVPAVQSAVGY